MILDQFKLDGKVAIVTGASRGLGQAIAVALAEAGADVAGVSTKGAHDTGKRIEAVGRGWLDRPADLGSTAPIAGIVADTISRFERVDILVNNAGIIRRDDSLDFSEADWDAVMDVNLKSLFFLSQAVARRYVEQQSGGKIVNVASLLSYQGGIRVPSYTASKHGVLGLTRLLSNEWAKHGINVNGIAPGYMVTDNTEALRKDGKRSHEILGRIPAGRWGEPEDLAGAAVFLSSAAADYVNGFTLAVDGGWMGR